MAGILSELEQEKYLELASQGNYDAQQILFECNQYLVTSIINKNYYYINSDNKKDLHQVGSIGLWKAIKNYNPAFNTKLSTYAVSMILGEIKTYLRGKSLLSIPRSIQCLTMKIASLQKQYEKEGKNLDKKELANILDVSENEINLAFASKQNVISLSQQIFEDKEELFLVNAIPDTNEPFEDKIVEKLFIEEIKELINGLEEKQKKVVKLLFGIDCKQKTQKEVAKILGISQAHVSRINGKALNNLKKIILENEDVKNKSSKKIKKINYQDC